MLSKAMFQKSVTVKGIRNGHHISCSGGNRVWVSDYFEQLLLTNTSGETLASLTDYDSGRGAHAVTKVGDLIYIDKNNDINKLSANNKTKTLIIKSSESWTPHCICTSQSTEDLLVGMTKNGTGLSLSDMEAKILRYNAEGQSIQTIQYAYTGQKLYTAPIYIAENLNGDVIESDWNRVVVTDRRGNYRFSYPEDPFDYLSPWGVCTDSLLHILICDTITYTVKMLDKDGYFLQYLLSYEHGITEFRSLSYDFRNDLLWVGSLDNNILSVFKYIEKESNQQDHEEKVDKSKEKELGKANMTTTNEEETKENETDDENKGTSAEAGANGTNEMTGVKNDTEMTGPNCTAEIADARDATEIAGAKVNTKMTGAKGTTKKERIKDTPVEPKDPIKWMKFWTPLKRQVQKILGKRQEYHLH
ncbi:uncharacterized protein LOC134271058 [Saccostrea cucullata]|uniref:uncharacterized protein LOC134271058 n=1 Tax=Saccostrea cuccullata TaxID=36930 RepID=UPI002ED6A2B5